MVSSYKLYYVYFDMMRYLYKILCLPYHIDCQSTVVRQADSSQRSTLRQVLSNIRKRVVFIIFLTSVFRSFSENGSIELQAQKQHVCDVPPWWLLISVDVTHKFLPHPPFRRAKDSENGYDSIASSIVITGSAMCNLELKYLFGMFGAIVRRAGLKRLGGRWNSFMPFPVPKPSLCMFNTWWFCKVNMQVLRAF